MQSFKSRIVFWAMCGVVFCKHVCLTVIELLLVKLQITVNSVKLMLIFGLKSGVSRAGLFEV